MCLILDQFLWGHSSRVCDISCFFSIFAGLDTATCRGKYMWLLFYYNMRLIYFLKYWCVSDINLCDSLTGHTCFKQGVTKEFKGLGSRRGEISPAIEMHTDLKYVYMVYLIEKNLNFICLVLKL